MQVHSNTVKLALKPITKAFIISNKTAQINIIFAKKGFSAGLYSAQTLSLGMKIYLVDVERQVAGYPTIQQ